MAKPVTSIPFFNLGRLAALERAQLHEVLDQVIDSGQFIGGAFVEQFESEFAALTESAHCVAVGNGLDAIRLLLEANGIGPGDEVIVPAFTYYASWLAVMQVGATLVPVDVDVQTSSIRPDLVEAAITPRTKAILVVHLYGIPSPMREIVEIARENDIKVFEDTAQAHDGRTDLGTPCGGSSDGGAFSFYPTKNLGALGDAGAIVVDDAQVAQRLRSRRSYGQGANKYDHVDTGWNSRLDPVQAGVLSLHLNKLVDWTERRRFIAGKYIEALADKKMAVVGGELLETSVWHHCVVRASNRERFMSRMQDLGIATDIHYPYWFAEVAPVVRFAGYAEASFFRGAAELSAQVVSLPMGPWLTDDEVFVVAEALAACRDDLVS